MLVKDALNRDVHPIAPATPVAEAAREMLESDVGYLPVVDQERLVGILTDRDIVLRCVAESKSPERTPVSEVMSFEVVCCFTDQDLEEARRLMSEHNLQRLPVIDENHHLVGFVSRLAPEESTDAPRKKAVKVTFQKEKTDSYGRPHLVPFKTVYVTGKQQKQEAEAVAVDVLQKEKQTEWTNVANSFETQLVPPEDK
jgi:CBS domain-containing protein